MSSFAPAPNGSEPPDIPLEDIQPPNFKAAGKAIGDGLGDSTWLKKQLVSIQDWVVDEVSAVLAEVLRRIANIIGYLGKVLVKMREELDPSLGELASEGIADLLGQDLPEEQWKQLGDKPTRKQIAQLVGTQILNGLAVNLANAPNDVIQPSDEPAKNYITRMAELSIEGWFESVVTGLVSEHPFEKIGELKEQVSGTFGFSRLTRRVLSPAIDALVADPFKWKINKQYRPKLLSEGQAIDLYMRQKLSKEDMTEQLARQGYSADYIDRLQYLAEKFLGAGEVAFLVLAGTWSREEAIQYLQSHGYSEGIAGMILDHEKQRRIDAARREALRAATEAYVHREIDVTEFTKFLDQAVVDADVKHELLASASARQELNRTHVSEAKAEEAVILGFWGIDQYAAHLQRLGYNDDDVLTMHLLVMEKLKEASDKAAKKKAAADAAAAAKAARLKAAQDRQAALDQKRAHKDLTLAQVHRAYVQGRLTLANLQQFLIADKQAPEDIQTLITLAQAERADYAVAQAKKIRANEKLAVTTLSTSQLEHLVKTGVLAIADYQSILEKEGVSSDDISLLVKAAQVDLAAAQAAQAHRAAVEKKAAEKGLSLAQMELAVRQGLRTMADFKAWLAANNYGPADQASLIGLLQDRIDADKVAEEKKAATTAKLQHKGISLAQLELAVRKGIRPIADYQQALLQAGEQPADVSTLSALIQRKMDDDAALAARKAEAVTKAATKGISLAEIERAARLGIVSLDFFRQALVKAGMPAEDQDIMVGLVQADIAKTETARAHQAAAAAKLQNKPVSLGALKQGVVSGILTIEDYKLTLKQAGFSADAVDLMAELAQDEFAQRQAAEKKKAALDAKRSVREIARADFEKAVTTGLKTLADYKAFLQEQSYDEEDTGILYDLLAAKLGEPPLTGSAVPASTTP